MKFLKVVPSAQSQSWQSRAQTNKKAQGGALSYALVALLGGEFSGLKKKQSGYTPSP